MLIMDQLHLYLVAQDTHEVVSGTLLEFSTWHPSKDIPPALCCLYVGKYIFIYEM